MPLGASTTLTMSHPQLAALAPPRHGNRQGWPGATAFPNRAARQSGLVMWASHRPFILRPQQRAGPGAGSGSGGPDRLHAGGLPGSGWMHRQHGAMRGNQGGGLTEGDNGAMQLVLTDGEPSARLG